MTPVTDSLLEEMAEVIAKAVNPLQIILFGSHARGTASSQSDVDILVVEDESFGPERSRNREMTRLWELLAPYMISKDILVFSRDEVERWKGTRNHVIARALREGKVLYDRH